MPDDDMNLKIVYLGWGSLIWDYSNLPINSWKQSELELPLEFSRISDYGHGRMTLVIDQNGTMNKVPNKIKPSPKKIFVYPLS